MPSSSLLLRGPKGIDLVEAEAPDLVMADFCLSDMNGLDLVAKVREFSDVPLVIIVEQETGMERARVLESRGRLLYHQVIQSC